MGRHGRAALPTPRSSSSPRSGGGPRAVPGAMGRMTPDVVVDADPRPDGDRGCRAPYGATLAANDPEAQAGHACGARSDRHRAIAFLAATASPGRTGSPSWRPTSPILRWLRSHRAFARCPAPGAPFRERFAAARSPDRHALPRRGRWAPCPYVPPPGHVRRAASSGRDPALRIGEDVDLVGACTTPAGASGSDPTVIVAHSEPAELASHASAPDALRDLRCPLPDRRPGRLAPLVLRPVQP